MIHAVKALALLMIVAMFCACQNKTSNWPKEVTSSLIVPETSTDIKYYELSGSYQAMYKTAACYPAEQFIKLIADQMTSHGWKRLQENSLNPGIKNSWARGGTIFEQWGFFLEKGDDVHQWVEEWEDGQRNLVTYFLRYRTKRKGNQSISSKDCDLEVTAIYVPKAIRPSAADLESMRSSK